MKKRIIALVVTIALLLGTLPLAQIFADAKDETETKNFLTKTAEWTDADKDEVKISLESANASDSLADNILFLGSLCGNHSLTEETVIKSLNVAAKKANVDYRLWYSPKATVTDDPELGAANGDRELFAGSLAKDEQITDKSKLSADLAALQQYREKDKNKELGEGAHNSLYDFAASLVEASKAEKTYDFIIMEFDGVLLGEYTGGSVAADSTEAKNLDAASKFIADYYKEGRVAWIVPTLANGKFMYFDSKLDGTTQTEKNTRNVLKLLAPEDLASDGSIPSNSTYKYAGEDKDGSGKYRILNTFKTRMKAAADSDDRIWVSYANNMDVSDFLDKKLQGDKYETVIITDTIKKGFKFKSVSAKYKKTKTATTWSTASASTTNPKFTYETVKNDLGEDVVVGTFTGVSTLGHTLVKMEILATLDEANDPFPEISANETESADTNDGPAKAEYIPGDPKKPPVKSEAASPSVTKNYYEVTTSATNGTITETQKYVEGSSPEITYSPDQYYETDYIKVNDAPLSAQDLKTYASSYTFEKIAKDEEIEVAYKRSKVKVTFDPDNGSPTFDENIDMGTAVDEPNDDPEKTGYEFQYWKDEEGEQWDFDTLIYEDTTLTADYKLNEYRVDFDNNGHGGTAPAAKTGVKHGTTITAPQAPTDNCYDFEGWYTEATGGTKFDFAGTEITENKTLFAHWKEKEVTYNYYVNDGSGTVSRATETVKVLTGTPQGSAATPSTGYNFSDWTDSTGAEVSTNASFVPTRASATTPWPGGDYYANFAIRKYTVVFNNNGHGGTAPAAKENVEHGTTISAPKDPTDSNYDFEGWYTEATGGTKFDFAGTEITESKTLYAHWKEKEVTYNYSVNDGSGTVSRATETVKVLTGTPQGSTATPSTGYDFVNWTDSSDAEVSTNASFVPTRTSTSTPWAGGNYYANFKKHIYNVTFEMNGHGTQVSPQQVEYQAKATKPNPNPSETGWEFGGWYKDEGLTQSFNFATEQITKDTVIYAKWTEKQTTITYKANGGGKVKVDGQTGMTKSESIKVVNGTPKGATAVANSGYVFKNWTNEAKTTVFGTDVTFVPQKDATENIYKAATYYANFMLQVNFETNGHGTVPTQVIDIGAKATDPRISDAGYELVGWYDNDSFEGDPFDFNEPVYVPTTLYAKWKVVVTFVEPTGPKTPSDTEKHDIGGKTKERDEEPEGYELEGWYEDPECTKPFDFEQEITVPTTVYPKWVEKAATLTYDLGGGKFDQADDSQKMLYSKQTDVVKETPSRDGFIFKGYATSAEDAKKGIVTYAAGNLYKAENIVPADATLYAVWQEVVISPKTGASNRVMLWAAFALMMVAAFLSTVLIKKKVR